jgi:asparagine N-glycosylation enzyme membrane subunit Stt3
MWLLIGAIAAGVCSLKWPAAHYVDEYLPYGIDSFYHARRILDTVADPSAFYEIDYKIHAPEGSLLTWPWGYDYAMAWLVKAGLALGLAHDPMAILIWIPVAAVFLSIGLVMLIARRLGLSNGLIAVAGLATALSPLTQYLHGVGQIDHHYAEYIFVLATILGGLRWLSSPDDARAAALLGIVLGMAPAIHNGLFILQVPILASLLVLWLQNVRMPMLATGAFAAALLLTTVAILLPSLPFRIGLFEFYTLSWFHLYIAAGTAAASLALAAFAKNARNVGLLIGLACLLLFPLARQIIMARAFLAGTITRLETIAEMKPLPPMVLNAGGRSSLTQVYSMLFWVSPLAVAYCAWRGWQERATARVLFWMCCIFGFALLLTQVRMQYFGSYVLYLPWLILAQTFLTRWEGKRKLVTLSVGMVFLLAYWLPARYVLPSVSSPGGDSNFRVLRPILEDLRKACAQDPGIVLADNDAGHYIRYHTDCSVIANNFLLTPQHEQKIRQIDYLTSIPAAAFPGVAPFVRYILVRPVLITRGESEAKYMSYSQRGAALVQDLLLKPLEQIPPSYVLIEQASLHDSAEQGTLPYIRLFKVNPVGPRPLQTNVWQASPKAGDH